MDPVGCARARCTLCCALIVSHSFGKASWSNFPRIKYKFVICHLLILPGDRNYFYFAVVGITAAARPRPPRPRPRPRPVPRPVGIGLALASAKTFTFLQVRERVAGGGRGGRGFDLNSITSTITTRQRRATVKQAQRSLLQRPQALRTETKVRP